MIRWTGLAPWEFENTGEVVEADGAVGVDVRELDLDRVERQLFQRLGFRCIGLVASRQRFWFLVLGLGFGV